MLPTPPTKTHNPDEIDELTELARQIRATHEEAAAEAAGARTQANRAITAALLCGKALNRAKDLVGHGNWLKWLGDHCRDLSLMTVSRYMRLAKFNTVLNFKDGTNLKQAYIQAGIIPCKNDIAQQSKSDLNSTATSKPCDNSTSSSESSPPSTGAPENSSDSDIASHTTQPAGQTVARDSTDKGNWIVRLRCTVTKDVYCNGCTEEQAQAEPFEHAAYECEVDQEDTTVLSVERN